jgi:hypothetical protein
MADDKAARVWDAASGRPLTPPLKHQQSVTWVTFSPGGRRVLTASHDRTARVWDAASGRPQTPPLKHQARVEHAAFSSDGRRILTASEDGTARVWDAASGHPLSPPLQHQVKVRHAVFSADGRLLVTAGADGTARVWSLSLEDRPAEDWVLLAEVLAGQRLDQYGALIRLSAEELRKGFARLRAKYPRDFTTRLADVLTWHRQEFEVCREEENGPAALFHYFHGHLEWALLTGRPLR